MKTQGLFRRVAVAAVAFAVIGSLASCGGSGGSDNGAVTPPVASNTPPASASASVDGFIAYLKSLVTIKDDTISPLDVTTFVAPTVDNTEPDLSI